MTLARLLLAAALCLGLLAGCAETEPPGPDAAPDTVVVAIDTPAADTATADTTVVDTAVADAVLAETTAAQTGGGEAAAGTVPRETAPSNGRAAGTGAETETAANGEDGISLREARDTARNFGLRVAFAVLVFVLTFFLIKGVATLLETLAERSAERRLLYKRIVPIARVVLWAVALYVVLRGIFEVDAQGLIAAAAAIGVAVGFAAQDLLKNIFGGLVIIFDTPFQVGDKISVGGTYGEVVGIGLRSTRIVTPDDNLVSVPNSQVVDGQVSNANAGALDCQVVTDLYLPGWVDEERAKQIAYEAAASSKYVYLQKPITVIVKDEFDDGHVVHLKVKAYVLDTRYEFLLASDVTERARRAFRREGLLVPATRAFVDLPATAGNGETGKR
jgi:small-conductance mechanosensitive channel